MLVIKTFGLLWERKYIHWGWGGKRGHLKGYRRGIKEADFREQRGIYVLYDKDMRPVYVGQTGKGKYGNLFNRLGVHEDDHLWNRWQYFSWFGICGVNKNGSLHLADRADRRVHGRTPQALDESEGILIHVLEPHLNKQGARWKNVRQFWQVIDSDVAEPTPFRLFEAQQEISKRLERLERRLNEKG
jgi:hypothetical protein